MTRATIRRYVIAAAGGFFVVGTALTLMYFTGLLGVGRSTVLETGGWMLPLLAAGVTGLVAWLLVRGSDARGPSCDWKSTGAACPSCGGVVRPDWRLCPHCGHRIGTV